MTLLTNDRLMALSRINRWGGWVKWDYSVLMHTVIGAERLQREGLPHKPFLLHDFEESEFSDVISPTKDLIPPGSVYYTRVARFNQRLYEETGMRPDGGEMDVDMAHAEHLSVASKGDPLSYAGRPVSERVDDLYRGILLMEDRHVHEVWIAAWWELWNAK